MDETKLLESIQALGGALRRDLANHCAAMDQKYSALADSITKKKKDSDDDMAEETAADRRAKSDSVSRTEMRVMQDQLRALQIAQPTRRPPTDLDALAEMQSKCDAVMRANGSRAEPPMQSETLVDYTVRMHRKMQAHSAKWKGAELATIARDPTTFAGVCDGIRADALTAALNPVGLPPFQHREILEDLPTGHKSRTFVGNGTMFAQLNRAGRRVSYIGTSKLRENQSA